MAGSHFKGSKSSVTHLFQYLNRQSNGGSIREIKVDKNCRSFLSIYWNSQQSRPFTSTKNFNEFSGPLLQVTSIVSHFLAGDLHIPGLSTNIKVQNDFMSRRNMARAASKRSVTYYYDVLGLNPNATQSQIKSAYYNMTKLHHPDVTECSKSRILITEINEAYEVLGNLKKKRLYDRGVFGPTDSRTHTTEEEDKDYTQAYKQRSNFERGNRPPPPHGHTRIYNFDEFYRQHYNDVRERRANEYRQYILYKEMMDRHQRKQESGFVFSTVAALFLFGLIIGLMTTFEKDRDRNALSRKETK